MGTVRPRAMSRKSRQRLPRIPAHSPGPYRSSGRRQTLATPGPWSLVVGTGIWLAWHRNEAPKQFRSRGTFSDRTFDFAKLYRAEFLTDFDELRLISKPTKNSRRQKNTLKGIFCTRPRKASNNSAKKIT